MYKYIPKSNTIKYLKIEKLIKTKTTYVWVLVDLII